MSRYNHFSICKYRSIPFGSISVGDKFRMDKRKNGRIRMDIVMVKTSDLAYQELKSKKKYSVFHANFDVSEFQPSECGWAISSNKIENV